MTSLKTFQIPNLHFRQLWLLKFIIESKGKVTWSELRFNTASWSDGHIYVMLKNLVRDGLLVSFKDYKATVYQVTPEGVAVFDSIMEELTSSD